MKKIVMRAVLLLLVLAAGVYAIFTGIPAYLRGEGAAAAALAWEEGTVIHPRSDAHSLSISFDERTGLAHVSRPWSELFCDGYNNYVNQRLKKGESPSNARKQWAKEVAKPQHYIASLPPTAFFFAHTRRPCLHPPAYPRRVSPVGSFSQRTLFLSTAHPAQGDKRVRVTAVQ